MPTKQIGIINENIVRLLNLPYAPGTPIFLGMSNIEHMKSSHPLEYEIYSEHIENIIANPDYVAFNKDNSIEYVKEFKVDNEFVKIAVRITASGRFFVRTLYTLNPKRVQDFICKGTLKKV